MVEKKLLVSINKPDNDADNHAFMNKLPDDIRDYDLIVFDESIDLITWFRTILNNFKAAKNGSQYRIVDFVESINRDCLKLPNIGDVSLNHIMFAVISQHVRFPFTLLFESNDLILIRSDHIDYPHYKKLLKTTTNSCFMDSIMVPLLYDETFLNLASKSAANMGLLNQLQKMHNQMKFDLDAQSTCASLHKFLQGDSKLREIITSREQHDDSEFLQELLLELGLKLTNIFKTDEYGNSINNYNEFSCQYINENILYVNLNTSLNSIIDIYQNVHVTSHTKLPFPRNKKVSRQYSKIVNSNLLIFHIDRAQKDGAVNKKLVTIPENINNALDGAEYELYIVTVHHGPNVSFGHYTSFFKHLGNWFKYDNLDGVSIVPYDAIKNTIETQSSLVLYKCIHRGAEIVDGFPFYKYIYPSVFKMYEQLTNLELATLPTTGVHNLGIVKRMWPQDTESIDHITDHFVEPTRIKCNELDKPSPLQVWENIHSTDAFKNMTIAQRREAIYKQARGCNLFNTVLARYIYALGQGANGGRVLDPCAGWGDRLIAAFASQVGEYHGYDTNGELQPVYQSISDTLPHTTKWIVHHEPFERATVRPEYYNLVILSPPFYTQEIYLGAETSTNLYKTIDEWYEKFYTPLLTKSMDALQDKGVLALYIPGYMEKITFKILQTVKFMGRMGFVQSAGPGTKENIRNVYCFEKTIAGRQSAGATAAPVAPIVKDNHDFYIQKIFNLPRIEPTKYKLDDTFSSSQYAEMQRFLKNLETVINTPLKNLTIIDGCSNIGGTTYSFAQAFKKVYAYEYDASIYKMLVNNMELALPGYKRPTMRHASFLDHDYVQEPVDILAIDPPWGGPESTKDTSMIPFIYEQVDRVPGGPDSSKGPVTKVNIADWVKANTDLPVKYILIKVPPDHRVESLLKNFKKITIPVYRNIKNVDKHVYSFIVIDMTQKNPQERVPEKKPKYSLSGDLMSVNPNLTWDQVIKSPKVEWNWTLLSKHPNIDYNIIKSNPDKPWVESAVAENPSVTWEIFQQFPNTELNLFGISKNPNITMDIVRANPDKPWNYTGLSQNRNLTLDIVKANPKKPWKFWFISRNPNITWDMVKANRDMPWNFDTLTENPNITLDIITQNPKEKWSIESISKNPNITWEYIQDNPEQVPWNYFYMAANPNITMDIIKKHPEKNWDYGIMSENPNVTWPIVEANPDKHWDPYKLFDRFSKEYLDKRGKIQPSLKIDIVVSNGKILNIVRDDVLLGGSKERAALEYIKTLKPAPQKIMYTGAILGFGPIATAQAAHKLKIPCHLVLYNVPFGSQSIVSEHDKKVYLERLEKVAPNATWELTTSWEALVQKGKEYEKAGYFWAPLGLHDPTFIDLLAKNLKEAISNTPGFNVNGNVWVVAGTCTFAKALSIAAPKLKINIVPAVNVGKSLDKIVKCAQDIKNSQVITQDLKTLAVPYPTVPFYDSKSFAAASMYGQNDDYVWNIAGL